MNLKEIEEEIREMALFFPHGEDEILLDGSFTIEEIIHLADLLKLWKAEKYRMELQDFANNKK